MLNSDDRMCRFNCISIPGVTNHIQTCLRCTFFNYIMFEMFVDRSQTSYQYAENSIKGNNRIITNVVVKRTRIETLFILFDNVADLRAVNGCSFIISNVSEQLCVVNLTTILSRPRRVLNINKIEKKQIISSK